MRYVQERQYLKLVHAAEPNNLVIITTYLSWLSNSDLVCMDSTGSNFSCLQMYLQTFKQMLNEILDSQRPSSITYIVL